MLALLLDAPGANPNLSANDGATPILIAAQNGHIKVVRFLIEKAVDVKKTMNSGATALFVAAQNGILEVADCLVAHDKSLVNMSLHNGTSPFYVAAQNGHLKVVTFLYEKNADIWKKSCGGASPFFIAAQNGHLELLKFLLEVEGKNSRRTLSRGSNGPLHLISVHFARISLGMRLQTQYYPCIILNSVGNIRHFKKSCSALTAMHQCINI